MLSVRLTRILESVWNTALVVVVAYLSLHITSARIPFDELYLGIVVVIIVVLDLIAHHGKIRGSGNRWMIFGNSSVAWFFAVFIGAISGGLPALFSLVLEIPVLLFVAGIFLGFVFVTVDLSKHVEQVVKSK